MPTNSHIQLPRCILKQFMDQSGQVFYLELKGGRIAGKGPRGLGTEHGYFSDTIEAYLSKRFEQPIADLNIKVKHLYEDKDATITLTSKDEDTVKNYIVSAMARGGVAKRSFEKNSFTAALFSEQQNHDALVLFSTQNSNALIELIKHHTFAVLLNQSTANFVVPRNCFYTASSKGFGCIVAPISPRCAWMLRPPDYPEEYIDGELVRLGFVSDANTVRAMNTRALFWEFITNKEFVAANRLQELEELQLIFQENKDKLSSIET